MSIIHQNPTKSRSRSLGWRIAGTAILATALASSAVAPAHASLVGPRGAMANGFPSSYSDGRLVLGLCINGEQCMAQAPATGALTIPGNFPDEAFWFSASAATVAQPKLYGADLEAAFLAPGVVVDGQQRAFARLRFRLDNLVTGATYTIQHPYGTRIFRATSKDPRTPTAQPGEVNVTEDSGCLVAPCNFDLAKAGFLDNFTVGTANFLTQANPADGFIGDIVTPGFVGGAPSGINAVIVKGPNAGGQGINTLTVNEFNVQGQLAGPAVAPSAPRQAPTVTAGKLSAFVRWSAPAHGGSNITQYSVRITNATTGALIKQQFATPAATTSANSTTVTGLPVGVSLRASVQARNAVGTGSLSVASGAVRPQSTPGPAIIRPASFGAVGGAITATANWLPPLSNNGNLINGYVVTALRMNPGGPVLRRTNSVVQHFSKRTLSMTLPAGSYRFVVRARNGWGLGVATSAMSNMVVAR